MSINANPEDNTTPEATEDKPKMSVAEAFAKWFEDNLDSHNTTVEEFFSIEEDTDEDEETTTTEEKSN